MQEELISKDVNESSYHLELLSLEVFMRMKGTVKSCLGKVLFRKVVNVDNHTILVEIECRVNNHPSSHVANDLGEPESLTPSHLLHGYRLNSLLAVSVSGFNLDPSHMDVDMLNSKYQPLS